MKDLKRRIRELETSTAQQKMSITKGRMRFIGGLLRIDSGGRVEIVGTLQIDGTTLVTGTFRVNGPWTLAGDGTISGNVTGTGTLTWNGPWNLNGPGKIAGNTDLTGDLRVSGGGKIRAGNVIIDPSSNGGSMKFGSGPEVYASGSVLALYSGALNGGNVELAPGSAKMSNGGTRWIEVTSGGLRLVGVPKVAKAGVPVGCFYKGTDGYVYEG